jgi:hypothetical protein
MSDTDTKSKVSFGVNARHELNQYSDSCVFADDRADDNLTSQVILHLQQEHYRNSQKLRELDDLCKQQNRSFKVAENFEYDELLFADIQCRRLIVGLLVDKQERGISK